MKSKIYKILAWSQKYTKTDMEYLANGLSWFISGKIIVIFLSFVLMLAFSHFASKETFGAYQYILSVLGIISIVSLPGMNTALVKSVAQKKEGTFQYLQKVRTSWSLLGSVIIFLLALWYFYQSNTTLGIALVVSAIGFPFMYSFDLFEYFWNGRKDFKKNAYYSVLSSFVPVVGMIGVMLFSENLIWLIFAFLTGNFIIRFILTQKTKSAVIFPEIDPEAEKLGKSLTFVQGVDIVAGYIDKIFVWKFFGAIPLAVYSFAQIPISKIQQLAPIQALALPKLSETGNKKGNKELLDKFLKLFLVMIPIAIIFILLVPFLYKIFFPQYIEAISYARGLSFLIALMPFTFLTTAMIAENKNREMVGIQTATFILKIILFFITIKVWGIWGIIFSIVFTEIIKGFATLYFFTRK